MMTAIFVGEMMKKFSWIALIAVAVTLSSGQASAILMGELDPALEREYSNPPTFGDCYRLGWIRGVHFEIHGEQEVWMKQCLAGNVPFHLDGRRNRGNRNERK